MTEQRASDLNFEKWALGLLSAFIVVGLGYMLKTVSDNQVQYARIEERLANANALLVDLKGRFDTATKYRLELENKYTNLERRVIELERRKD